MAKALRCGCDQRRVPEKEARWVVLLEAETNPSYGEGGHEAADWLARKIGRTFMVA
jgi:hypothetical protein